MPIGVKSINLPVTYEISDYVDDRFKKVKIWIAHTGENLNYSIFTKESLEKMSETLPYVPIVGYIEKNEEDENVEIGSIEYYYTLLDYWDDIKFISTFKNEKSKKEVDVTITVSNKDIV